MAVYDLYSKRQKILRGEINDVYAYDEIPNQLIVQIIHIWNDVLGSDDDYKRYAYVKDAYFKIVRILRKEYGVFELAKKTRLSLERYNHELVNFILNEKEVDKILSAIELSFEVINVSTRHLVYRGKRNFDAIADDAISELNCRFKEHGVGYYFVDNKIIRIDSELIHVEIVKPVLRLLNSTVYAGAQEEFLSAYEHYRHQNNKEALNDCLKAFESTMKAICTKRGWVFDPTATSKQLIQICYDNDLVPLFWQNHYSSLRSMLEGSVPTGRNKLSGHGQGAVPTEVPNYIVSYMLHMTASTILFMCKSEENLA